MILEKRVLVSQRKGIYPSERTNRSRAVHWRNDSGAMVMADVKRESGWYWVKYRGGWELAMWIDDVFMMVGRDYGMCDAEMCEIDERRITRD